MQPNTTLAPPAIKPPVVEKVTLPSSGGGMLLLSLLLLLAIPAVAIFNLAWLSLPLGIAWFVTLFGFLVINPNESKVLTFFGTYVGTVKKNGFYWVNPLYTKRNISLRARNLNGATIKVNDKMGSPIEIAAVIVWQVAETARAAFEVDNYELFVHIQSEAAIRHLAGTYAYDNIEDEEATITLRGGADVVSQQLEHELNERLSRAGIHVLEARLSHLAYAPEIAGAMLQRQQATAVVAARKQIVEGAVSMVEMALDKLSKRKIVELDEVRKAAMVSNLLVVLCADRAVTPVVNSGSPATA